MSHHPGRSLSHIVVVGSGFGGLEAAFYLRHRLGHLVGITLVAPEPTFHFKPNTIYVPFGKAPERYVIPLAHAFETRGIEYVQGRATAVDPARKTLRVGTRDVPYDYLVLATGATMRAEEIPGLAEHAHTIWTPQEMGRLRKTLEALVASDARQRVLFLVPPNNKCSGPLYEMVLMLDTWLKREGARGKVDLAYATYERAFVQAFGPRIHDVVDGEFRARGIAGHLGHVAARVEAGAVRFSDGTALPYDVLVSFPPYVASTRFEGLPMDERGFLRTDVATRQVVGHPDVYAVGDGGDFPVKQAFLALLQADAVGEHISQRVMGIPPDAAFDPVSMCIMEQLDKATFAQVPLRLTGDPALPVEVRPDALEDYKVGTGELWRVGKKLLGTVLPMRFRQGRPFHAGATWATMEVGLKAMSAALAD